MMQLWRANQEASSRKEWDGRKIDVAALSAPNGSAVYQLVTGCCAADATPMIARIELATGQLRNQPPGTPVRVRGKLTFVEKAKPVIGSDPKVPAERDKVWEVIRVSVPEVVIRVSAPEDIAPTKEDVPQLVFLDPEPGAPAPPAHP